MSPPESLMTTNVHLLHPPHEMKPPDYFKKLIREYKIWISQHRDRGQRTFLKSFSDPTGWEDTPREIRRLIKNSGKASSGGVNHQAMKWHMILHLAREHEENLLDAETLIEETKQKGSPLAGLVADAGEVTAILDDLPVHPFSAYLDDHHMREIMEAWIGLFGAHLSSHSVLITWDEYIYDGVKATFEEYGPPLLEPSIASPIQEDGAREKSLVFPIVPRMNENLKNSFLMALSGKTLIFHKGAKG